MALILRKFCIEIELTFSRISHNAQKLDPLSQKQNPIPELSRPL